jgi:hypothetical protein
MASEPKAHLKAGGEVGAQVLLAADDDILALTTADVHLASSDVLRRERGRRRAGSGHERGK